MFKKNMEQQLIIEKTKINYIKEVLILMRTSFIYSIFLEAKQHQYYLDM